VKRMFQSLSVRNYRLFASGQLVSLTGTWMQRIAQDWLVLRLSHNSGTAIGITTGLQFLPLLFLGLYGGVVADRHSKRKILICTQVAMGVCAGVLACLDLGGVVTLWEVYLLALLLGGATAIDNPTRQAFVTEMVGPDSVVNAVGLNSATFNSARIVGPAVAGVLIAVIGTGWVFAVNGVSYLGVILGLVLMRDSELFSSPRIARAPRQILAGLSYVRKRFDLLIPILLVGVIGTLSFNFQITLALMDTTIFHKNAAAYGLLSSCIAAGSLIGALIGARRTRPTRRILIGGALVFGVLQLSVGFMPSYLGVAILLIPTGLAAIFFSTAANTMVQLNSEPEMRGRVMGVYMLVFAGGTPVGAPLVGWMAQEFGARSSMWLGGTAAISVAVLAAVLALRQRAPASTIGHRVTSLVGARVATD
jgi:MFS family permease